MVHELNPVVGANFPAGQFTQEVSPAEEYFPTSQAMQSFDPKAELYVPE
jgi:hypothetical protein